MRLLLPLLLLATSLVIDGEEKPGLLERFAPVNFFGRDKRSDEEPSVYDDESSNRAKRLIEEPSVYDDERINRAKRMEMSYNEWEDSAASEGENRLKREEEEEKKKKDEEPEEESPAEEVDEEEGEKKKGKKKGWFRKGLSKLKSASKAVFNVAKKGGKMVVGGLKAGYKKLTGKKDEEEAEE